VTVRDEGVTRIRERYEVSSPLTGRLQRITLDVGDPVVADETVLARVEPNLPSLLDPREVATAEARVRAAGRRSEVARLRLQTARTEAEHAEAERVRLYQLSLQDAVSDIETDQAELASRLKSDARRAAEYAVEIAQYELGPIRERRKSSSFGPRSPAGSCGYCTKIRASSRSAPC
jgi:HlyD family secretion protein